MEGGVQAVEQRFVPALHLLPDRASIPTPLLHQVQAAADGAGVNPHPAGQLALNVPDLGEEPLPGVQHKYHETVLVFPKQGQT